jgi:hypothetical protein
MKMRMVTILLCVALLVGLMPAMASAGAELPQPSGTAGIPTETPVTTPENTAEPDPTATPENTAEPDPTATPENTAEPDPTATPENTAEPDPTATPENLPAGTPAPSPSDSLQTPAPGSAQLLLGGVSGAVVEIQIDPNGAPGTYATIQSAIDDIVKNDQQGQTYRILVPDGTFDRFIVPHGVSNITIEGSGNTIIQVGTGTQIPGYHYAAGQDMQGVIIWDADITLRNLILQGEFDGSLWCAAAVSTQDTHAGAGAEVDTQVTLDGLTLRANGKGIGFMPQRNCFTVSGCSFSGFEQAIYFAGDNYTAKQTRITGCTITDCTFAVHGYYGGGTTDAFMEISGNTIAGTNERFAVIAVLDQLNAGALKVSITDNDFHYTIVGGINLRKPGDVAQGSMQSVIQTNRYNRTSFVADAYWYAADDYGTTYYAPEIDGCIATWHANPLMENGNIDGLQEKIETALQNAGTTGNVVSINAPEQETFTLSKNAILLKEYIDLGTLVVQKTIGGNQADPDDEFSFELVLTDQDGALLSGTFDYLAPDGTRTSFSGGTLAFTLRGEEQITVLNLMPGIRYTVHETDSKGYRVEPAQGYEGVIAAQETVAAFKNTRNKNHPTEPDPTPTPEIPVLTPNLTPGVTPAPQTDVFVVPLEPQVPQTGDDTSFVLWTGALAALIACLVSVLKKAAR